MKQTVKNDIKQMFYNASIHHKAGRFAKAQKGYKKILKIKPMWAQPMVALGNLYLDRNRPDKARPLFERAAALTPPDLSACYQLGRMKQMDNDHQGAILLYERMLELQPQSGLVWNNIGVAYRETGKSDDAMASFQKAVRFAPQMAQAWNNLGVALDEQHRTDQAIDAYRKAIDIAPDYDSPHLNTGIILQKRQQFEQARVHYLKVLEIQPQNEIAQFMLKSISNADTPPHAAPVAHVRSIFNQCADEFESILVEKLAYNTPELLFNLVRPHLYENMEILDLGCGTGLGARLYQPFAKSLTGVDISEKMLEKAAEKKIYTRLSVFDIMQKWAFPVAFDLIYSSDVFVYFGDLAPIIKSAAASLAPGGKIAFSVEKSKDNSTDYQLFPSGRYAHSKNYIQDCLNRHGLTRLAWDTTAIRKQSGNPVNGFLVVAEKKASS